ncbi:MAG: D-alanyl-D-alanine carboxypeptidase [Ruminococcus sp.]|nr:D-alanyl-D-alanine carboxypeptidase [Ruminococcus sp.]
MKRVLAFLIAVFIAFAFCSFNSKALSVRASSAVLYCADNGEIYFSKNENKRCKPASTTKIMTALLTLEYAEKSNKQVKFTEDMITEGSSMYLKLGEVVTLRDLAVGILLCSGNDAANAAAITISGSKEKFGELMTERAKKIGMKNTNFVTPSGLDDDEHYTTAYDMALLMAEAMKNSDFQRLTSKKTETVNFIKPENKISTYSNHNRLLSTYEYCVGGKTGYTMAAGRCLVTAAKKDGLTLIAVTFDDKRDWDDHTAMYNYGFKNYRMKSIDDRDFFLDVDTVGGVEDKTSIGGEEVTGVVVKAGELNKIKREIFLDNFLYAPLKSGEKVGEIVYTLNGKKVAVHKLSVITDNGFVKENKSLWDKIKGFFNNAF